MPPNPLELVQRPAFGLLMRELLRKFDHVVVDTPAAAAWRGCARHRRQCGAALVIGRKGRTRMKAMNDLIAALGKGPAVLAGVIMNEF